LRWMLGNFYRYYPLVYIFTETKMNCFWEQMANPKQIIQVYQPHKVKQILDFQTKRVKAAREGKFKANINVLIIWDDCVPEEIMYDPIFKQIFFNGRHYHIGNWMNSQYFYVIPKKYRGNLDFVGSMSQEQRNQLEAFFEEMAYGGKGYQSFNSFLEMFKDGTQDRHFILFHVRDKSKPSIDRIYTGQAEDPGIFWVGCDKYWENNPEHLAKIKSGEARRISEWKFNPELFGLPALD